MIHCRPKMKLLYVAGPYRGDTVTNIWNARKAAVKLWQWGNAVICPHLNTAHFEYDCGVPDQVYLDGDLEILSRCDSIVMLPGWEKSQGAIGELEFAKALKLKVYYWDQLSLSDISELNCNERKETS